MRIEQIEKKQDYSINILRSFNNKIEFDFNVTDRVLVYNIISRYKVYNTLYDLDKPVEKQRLSS